MANVFTNMVQTFLDIGPCKIHPQYLLY